MLIYRMVFRLIYCYCPSNEAEILNAELLSPSLVKVSCCLHGHVAMVLTDSLYAL